MFFYVITSKFNLIGNKLCSLPSAILSRLIRTHRPSDVAFKVFMHLPALSQLDGGEIY